LNVCRDRHRLAASYWRTAILLDDNGFCFGSASDPHGIGELRRSFKPPTTRDRAKEFELARHRRALGCLPRPF
jgi:hypothetical protein